MNSFVKGLAAAAAAAGILLAGAVLRKVPVYADDITSADITAVQSEDTETDNDASEGSQTIDISDCMIMLRKTTYVMEGSAVCPDDFSGEDLVSVYYGATRLVKDRDYQISYSGNSKPGQAVLLVTGKGDYSGSCSTEFTIVPQEVSVRSLVTGNGGIRVEWDTVSSALGYQILYSTDPYFRVYHSTTVKDPSVGYVNLINIPRAGEKWYVKIRSFISADGTFSSARYGLYCKPVSVDVKLNIKKVTIPSLSYSYTGKAVRPTVKVWDQKGARIPEDSFRVTYSDNVGIGTAKLTVTCFGKYSGSSSREFYIRPSGLEITSVSHYKNGFTLKWSKAPEKALGYQVLYSTVSDFSSNVHSYTSADLADTSENFIKYPRNGEVWYVKVRAFITADGSMTSARYGDYSPVKSVSTIIGYSKLSRTAKIYSTAHYSPKYLGTACAGSTAALLEKKGRWYRISVSGVTGWVYNKAFGVTSNISGRINESNVTAYADDLIFEIGTSPAAIKNYVVSRVSYRAFGLGYAAASREYLAAYALIYHFGACFHHAQLCDLLLDRAGYDHEVIIGMEWDHGDNHYWNAYLTDKGWRYLDSTPFNSMLYGFADYTSYQVRHSRGFTWNASKYRAN